MTTEQYIALIDSRLDRLSQPDLILSAASETHLMQMSRIFDTGEKATGKIGSYATTPMYAGAKQFSKPAAFQPSGKPSQKVNTKKSKAPAGTGFFKNGKQRRSMYLRNGYRQLRSVQGLESSFVNLSYTADLRNDLTQHLVNTAGTFTSGVSSAMNAQKLGALKEKYGHDLFELNTAEREFFMTAVKQLLNSVIKRQ